MTCGKVNSVSVDIATNPNPISTDISEASLSLHEYLVDCEVFVRCKLEPKSLEEGVTHNTTWLIHYSKH